jgi:signal transduction histidine kinase
MSDLDRRPAPLGESAIDETFRIVVVVFRVLGLAWMAMLVVATLVTVPEANAVVAVAALLLAAGWTVFTAYVAFRRPGQLGTWWFVAADLGVALLVATASLVAGADTAFHGGYPMSSIAIGAYAGGLRIAVIEALVLTAQQVIVHLVAGENVVATLGNVVFIIFAIILGWSVEALRASERERRASQEALDRALTEQARHEERAALANRLHDSFLQTLHAIRSDADDAAQVRYLARRQERELRTTIDEFLSPYEHSFKAAMFAARDQVEDLYRFEIHAVVRDDAELDDRLGALVEAAREAMANAARHSGAEEADVYAEIEDGWAIVYVRDRGRGIDESSAVGHGITNSIEGRMASVGGTAELRSEPGVGTEVVVKVSASHD